MRPTPALVLAWTVPCLASASAVIPRPRQVRECAGDGFRLTAGTSILYADAGARRAAEMLADALRPATGWALPVRPGDGGAATIALVTRPDDALGEEGYRLRASGDGVRIEASRAAGLFYGTQTLRQLLPTEVFGSDVARGVEWTVPAVEIEDAPRFAWRALMLDEARNFHGPATVKKVLDWMAIHKLNVFHWHLTDDQGWRLEIRKYPRLTEVGARRTDTQIGSWKSPKRTGRPHEGFYTQAEIRQIARYAEDRHITIVPEIGMPGHASAAIASYPALGATGREVEVPTTYGKHANVYNVADENVYRMLSDILDEVVALFPGAVVHVGGDEVNHAQWKASKAVTALMEREGLKTHSDVQVYFTNRMARIIEAKGRRVMGWNEITGDQVHAGAERGVGTLSPSAVVQFWKGSASLMMQAIRKGHDTINSTHSGTYLDYTYGRIPLAKAYAFEPIPRGLEPKYHGKVRGFGCQMWGEWIHTTERMEFQMFPRLCAYAEVGWTPREGRDYADFKARLGVHLGRLDLLGIRYARGVIEVREYEKSDFAGFARIGAWDADLLRREYILDWDATPVVSADGAYEVAAVFGEGKHSLAPRWMALLADGLEIARDAHPGYAGKKHLNCVYRFVVEEHRPGTKYTVRAEVDKTGGAKGSGEIRMRRVGGPPAETR
ncbi:MAG: beta-N-acetylhexosaminidase [Planctomycetota bacterium]